MQAGGLVLLARQPAWRWWTLASFLARLPLTMTLLALILAGEAMTGSLAVGASLAGVGTAAQGLAALWRGRQLDRGELRRGIRSALALSAAAIAALAAAVALAAPLPVVFALAAAQGVASAALTGGYRALLPSVVRPQDLPKANGLEAVFVEVAFVAGPGLAGLLALVVGPVGVLALMSASCLGSMAATRRLPTATPPGERQPFSWFRARGARPVYALGLLMGATFGVFESALPARVAELGRDPASAGLLLTLIAVGSAVGGLVASARARADADVHGQAAVLLGLFGLLLLPLSLLGSVATLGVAMILLGAPIAPLNALGLWRLHGLIPAGRQAEGFSVYLAAILLGAGLGQQVTGLLLDDLGARTLLAASAAPPLLAAALLGALWLRGRDRLAPPAADELLPARR